MWYLFGYLAHNRNGWNATSCIIIYQIITLLPHVCLKMMYKNRRKTAFKSTKIGIISVKQEQWFLSRDSWGILYLQVVTWSALTSKLSGSTWHAKANSGAMLLQEGPQLLTSGPARNPILYLPGTDRGTRFLWLTLPLPPFQFSQNALLYVSTARHLKAEVGWAT